MSFIRTSFLVLCNILLGSLLHAMGPNFTIIIENNLKGNVYNIPLEVQVILKKKTRESTGEKAVRVISAGSRMYIDINSLDPYSKIVFSGYGTLGSRTVNKIAKFLPDLRHRWDLIKQTNQSDLVIKISTKNVFPKYTLDIDYATILSKDHIEAKEALINHNNALAAFGGITRWRLETVLDIDELLKDDVEWRKELLPKTPLVQRATTVEDVYRYILGLRPQYTSADIQNAVNNLTLEWDEKQFGTVKEKEFAKDVLELVKQADKALALVPADKS